MRLLSAIAAIVAVVAAFSAADVYAQDDTSAPFGLKWNASSDDIRSIGVNLSPANLSDFGTSYTATGLPKALSDMATVVLSFGYDDKLWRVAALSREFKNDQYGAAAKARYAEIEASLEKAYTAGSKFHRQSTDSYFGKPENFTYSLLKNEASWFSLYSSAAADIELSIGASGTSDSYWRLIYSYRDGEKKFRSGKKDAELDAL